MLELINLMKLNISTSEVKLTPDIQEVIDKKFTPKLEKYLHNVDPDLKEGNLRLSYGDRFGFKAKFEMTLPGNIVVVAEEEHKELAFAITALAKEVARRLRREKEKRVN